MCASYGNSVQLQTFETSAENIKMRDLPCWVETIIPNSLNTSYGEPAFPINLNRMSNNYHCTPQTYLLQVHFHAVKNVRVREFFF